MRICGLEVLGDKGVSLESDNEGVSRDSDKGGGKLQARIVVSRRPDTSGAIEGVTDSLRRGVGKKMGVLSLGASFWG